MPTKPGRLAWRKVISAAGETAWLEKLEFIGLERVAVTAVPGRKTVIIEAFALSRREADGLARRFGGRVREAPAGFAAAPRAPIRIRDRLVIMDSVEGLAAARTAFPGREAISIPAGAAFGTGEHATTASCLRLLCDLSGRVEKGRWSLLDLGTGSGILALAAKKLGARRVEGWDFDGDAVRTARVNVRANHAGPIALKKGLAGDAAKGGPVWDVVTANLYSEVLIAAAKPIVRAARPGGWIILSGILREQEADSKTAFRTAGAQLERTVHSGKWTTLLLSNRRESP